MRKYFSFRLYFFVLLIQCFILANVTVIIVSTTTVTQTILNDIANAFYTVTNNTKAMKEILQTMYADNDDHSDDDDDHDRGAYKMMNSTNRSTIYFDITDENQKRNGFSQLISVNRLDLSKPIFPNLTTDFMAEKRLIMAEKRQKVHLYHDMKNEFIDSFENQTMNSRDHLNSIAPHDLDTMEEISQFIYIGRANNPFGESVKWRMKDQIDGDRNKRGVKELYSIIKCATGCKPTAYNEYGCYCGFLGRGKPINGIDNCCRLHDICYEARECHPFLVYFTPYVWKCHYGRPICAKNAFAGRRNCAERLCECDVQLALCLKRFSCPRKQRKCRSHLQRL